MEDVIKEYETFLMLDEKSTNTINKYIRDTKRFLNYLDGKEITKQEVINYKNSLLEKYEATSVNSFLAAVNKLLEFKGKSELKVKYVRIQQSSYSDSDKVLTTTDYYKICRAAKTNRRNHLIINAICSTGIRVSELKFFTLEAIKTGSIEVRNKGKIRRIVIPEKLKNKLLKYAKSQKIESGIIFRTRNGNSVDRSYIWKMLKKLAILSNVDGKKVFPHNLRKLFARKFYELKMDIVKLADVLGHSSINTTRIYLKTSGLEHQKIVDVLGLVC